MSGETNTTVDIFVEFSGEIPDTVWTFIHEFVEEAAKAQSLTIKVTRPSSTGMANAPRLRPPPSGI